MILIKFIALLIALISIIKSYIDFKKKREVFVMFLFWVVVWCAAAVLVLFPQLVERVALGQSITLGSVMGLAYVFMLYIVYRVYAKASRIEYQQADLIRKLGLSKGTPSKKK